MPTTTAWSRSVVGGFLLFLGCDGEISARLDELENFPSAALIAAK